MTSFKVIVYTISGILIKIIIFLNCANHMIPYNKSINVYQLAKYRHLESNLIITSPSMIGQVRHRRPQLIFWSETTTDLGFYYLTFDLNDLEFNFSLFHASFFPKIETFSEKNSIKRHSTNKLNWSKGVWLMAKLIDLRYQKLLIRMFCNSIEEYDLKLINGK